MCGICGAVHFGGDAPSSEGLEAMKGLLHHRGPDEGGSWIEGAAALGHRRLSIIGVSDGAQPLANEDGNVVTVFNGEIYNHRELRERLDRAGHRFATRTDTEVLVHLWEEDGPEMVRSLRGMFAFAIWDRRSSTLFLARDRLGKKPLYYYEGPSEIVFASEIKSVLTYPGVPLEVREEAVHHYLAFGYVPSPLTAYRGIHSLQAAHTLTITKDACRTAKYWSIEFRDELRGDEALEKLEAAFDDAVNVRLESEVPLGVFLSGGLDSTAIAEAVGRHSGKSPLSATVAFDDPRYDESALARETADVLGTDHREDRMDPTTLDDYDRVLRGFDQPFADNSSIATYFLCENASRHLTVALSGDGGDELFAGYDRYRQIAKERDLRRRLGPLATLLRPASMGLPRYLRGRNFLESLSRSPFEALANTFRILGAHERDGLYTSDFAACVADVEESSEHLRRHYDDCTSADEVSRAQYVDYMSYLTDDVLVKVDRMSMAHSIEVRSPLLDQELVSLVARIAPEEKLHDGETKRIFRRLIEKRLPRRLIDRPKRGFTVPLGTWFRGDLKALMEERVVYGGLAERGIFDRGRIERLWAMQQRESRWRVDLSFRFWTLFVLESWYANYVDARRFEEPPPRTTAARVDAGA